MSYISRRRFLQTTSLAAIAAADRNLCLSQDFSPIPFGPHPFTPPPSQLSEFSYSDVSLSSDLHESQLMNTIAVLMALPEDSLLKPYREMAGLPAPGENLEGWYQYNPDYDHVKNFDKGFAPGAHFGQWVSALARAYAITGDEAIRAKVLRLNKLYAETISGSFYDKTRFPSYTFDKLVIGLIDSHLYAKDPQALAILDKTTDAALPYLPGRAVPHGTFWRTGKDKSDDSWNWDEPYTVPENLFLAYKRGAGQRYYEMAQQYLYDKGWFDPLSQNQNVFHNQHAYSHVNSLCSAMMAHMVTGHEKYLHAARNAFAMLEAQSFATGGWGPDEQLRAPDTEDVYNSLTNSHASFETPCGAYAHFKLTRYLLRATHDSHYGDSMEQMMYNTVLGAMPLQENGRNFYYSDYNFNAKRVYKEAHWACCSGTLPQVAADYRINTYLRGPNAVYVNLYIPSTLRWTEPDGTALSLTQGSDYPYESHIRFTLTATKPTNLALYFRIPEWAQGAQVSVNGTRQKVTAGTFAALHREWKDGDRVELELPLTTRLKPIDAKHADTVALLRGPLALMAIKREQDSALPKVTHQQLLAARRVSQKQWLVDSADGPVRMMPFTGLGELPYSLYLKVT